MKNIIIGFVVVVLIGVGIYFFTKDRSEVINNEPQNGQMPGEGTVSTSSPQAATSTASLTGPVVIGQSVQNRPITAHRFGTGEDEIIFVGGTHGGYSWNTALVAYELMDYLESTPSAIPTGTRVTVIPVLNPDGLNKTVGTAERFTATQVPSSQTIRTAGRFNANNVDLNRNFDCDWQANAKWQNTDVSGGTASFSEPEARALRDYVRSAQPAAVVVWYSAAGGVFASNCHEGVLPETNTITQVYAQGSGYPAYQEFNFYEITGDMVNWLAKERVPAISVLLSDHESTEWSKNRAGINALLTHYASN